MPSPAFTHRKEHSKQTSLQPVTGELLTLDSIIIVTTTVSISTISSGTGRQRGRGDVRKVTGGFHAVPLAIRAVAESPPTVSQGVRRRLFFLRAICIRSPWELVTTQIAGPHPAIQ